MAISDRLGTQVRRFAVERIKTFKPDPAKFAKALAAAEARGDAHVIKNLALAAEKYAGHGENARLGAEARRVFTDGAAQRVDRLITSRPAAFKSAAEYQKHLARLEETVVAHQQMVVKPIAGQAAATTAKNEAHAAAYPALEAVLGDLARAKKTFEASLKSAQDDLAQAQRALATAGPTQKGQAQAWVDRAQTNLQKIELEAQQRAAKPTQWVATEQAKYDTKLNPLISALAKATGEVEKVQKPIGPLGKAMQTMETAVGGLKSLWWKLTQKFDPQAAAAARQRLGV